MKLIVLFALALFAAPPAVAQDTTQTVVDSTRVDSVQVYRNPHRARMLGSFIPGAGHIYAGEYIKGYYTGVATIGVLTLGPLIFQMNRCTFSFLDPSCKPGPRWPYQALGAYMVGEGVWAWIASARDASHAAERANLRHSSRKKTVTPMVQPSATVTGKWNAGINVSW